MISHRGFCVAHFVEPEVNIFRFLGPWFFWMKMRVSSLGTAKLVVFLYLQIHVESPIVLEL